MRLFLVLFAVPGLACLALSNPARGMEDLLVVSRFTNNVLRFDGETGQPLGEFAANPQLVNGVGITFGPDGNFYVSSFETDHVLQFDGATGAFLRIFATGNGLDTPMGLTFGNDGHLYVCSASSHQVLRYDGATGEFIDEFARNLATPIGITFGPDGDLYVGSVGRRRVQRFDGRTGASKGVFASERLASPQDLEFGPDGNLYVVDATWGRVLRFDGSTGTFLDFFITEGNLRSPIGMAFDRNGDLVIGNQMQDSVLRYDGLTGELLSTLVAPGSGGLDGASFLLFMPRPAFELDPPAPGVSDELNRVTVRGGRPGARVRFVVGAVEGTVPVPGCSGVSIGIADPVVRGIGIADGGGLVSLRATIPARLAGRTVFVQALDRGGCRASNVVRLVIR